MKIISHRRNKIEELKETPTKYGVEVDIRSQGENLIIHHDAFQTGELFENWISHYNNGTLILNVKEEGLEERLIHLMKEKGIEDYFFLDQSFPFLVKWSLACVQRCAVRVSEFESIDTALSLIGKAKWVWVDCFNQFPLTYESTLKLKNAGFNLCLVSPELQGRHDESEIHKIFNLFKDWKIKIDAVCTKKVTLWESLAT